MSTLSHPAMTTVAAGDVGLDQRPPGERYYRHPGDVIRLVLWAAAAVLLVLFIEVATGTSSGMTDDLGGAAASVPRPAREFVLALVQVSAVLIPVGVLIGLVIRTRWRRTGLLIAAAASGALLMTLLDRVLDIPGSVPEALPEDGWLTSSRFPTLVYVAGALAAATVGKPWLARGWRRVVDAAMLMLVVTMVLAGNAGVPELLLAVAVGAATGAGLLVAFGAPNRRPSPATVATALRDAGLPVVDISLERAVGGRSQLYRTSSADGARCFVKVYAQDSRDADLLYRGYRTAVLRDSSAERPATTLEYDVEHEALLLMLARQGGVACPSLRAVTVLPDGSMTLAMGDVGGRRLDELTTDELTPDLLDAVWREVAALHGAGLAHRSLHATNVLVTDTGPVLIDLGYGQASAPGRLLAIDRAELLASLAALVGVDAAVAAADRNLDPADLAAAMPYLQPLALSTAIRKQTGKAMLRELRTAVAAASEQEPVPLEQLVRVRPRTLLMVATLTGAFYFLLPQLANVDESIEAVTSANWGWLAGAVVLSGATYVFSAIGMDGGVEARLPLVPTVHAQLASSFVNRVTPANVGGMALNVRYMQKAGVEPAAAVTGMGLNVIAGGIVHIGLLFLFLAWAGRSEGSGFSIPSSSKLLVAIAVVLALVGLLLATRWGRRFFRTKVLRFVKDSLSSMAALTRSPGRLLALFGGSVGVTLAYAAALACAIAAFDGGVSFAQVGAVYLGSSVIAAAAPTPGGLGAMEAALVAGFTAIGMDSAIAVAAVLSYRLATFWLPILPGWLSFRHLDRRGLI
jgi:glycosyltransferase 2 family protein